MPLSREEGWTLLGGEGADAHGGNPAKPILLAKVHQNTGFLAILSRILIQDYKIILKQQFHIFHISPIPNLIKVSEKTRLSGAGQVLSQKKSRQVCLDAAGRDVSETGNSDAAKSTVTLGCIKIERLYMQKPLQTCQQINGGFVKNKYGSFRTHNGVTSR